MASQNLILLEDVDSLGLAGEEIRVAPGYARNYLIPKGLAAKASPGALRQLESRKEKIAEQRKATLETAQALADKLAKVEVTISMQASDDEQLFGSVNARSITDELAKQEIEIDHNSVKLAEPIKELGMFNVDIRLHAEVTASVKVWVVRA